MWRRCLWRWKLEQILWGWSLGCWGWLFRHSHKTQAFLPDQPQNRWKSQILHRHRRGFLHWKVENRGRREWWLWLTLPLIFSWWTRQGAVPWLHRWCCGFRMILLWRLFVLWLSQVFQVLFLRHWTCSCWFCLDRYPGGWLFLWQASLRRERRVWGFRTRTGGRWGRFYWW